MTTLDLLDEERWTDRSNEELLAALKDLSEQLRQERRKSGSFAEELRLAREKNLEMQARVEQEEEYISNKLLKRLEQLKKEKQLLANEVEQEEEFLTNTLQKRLEKLNKEKVDLEIQLEAEQEYIVNKLQKQLEHLNSEKTKLTREKVDLENQLEAEQEYIVNKLQKQVEQLDSEKKKLLQEKVEMQRQVDDMDKSVRTLKCDKVSLESAMEMEEENIVNRMQKQLDLVLEKHRHLEKRLESKGITLKELGAEPITVDNLRRSASSRSYASSASSRSFNYSASFTQSNSPPGWREAKRSISIDRRALSRRNSGGSSGATTTQ